MRLHWKKKELITVDCVAIASILFCQSLVVRLNSIRRRVVGTVMLGAIAPPDFDRNRKKNFFFKRPGIDSRHPDFRTFLRPCD